MNEWYPIPAIQAKANQSDVIRNVRQYLKNPIGATLTLLTPPSAFEASKTRINGNDLEWSLGNHVTSGHHTYPSSDMESCWSIRVNGDGTDDYSV